MSSPAIEPSNISPLTGRRRLMLAALVLLLTACAALLVKGSAVTKDAAQNLQMAVNLAHTGTMSDAQSAPFAPSMYREPLPVLVSAGVVKLVDAWQGRADSSQYFSGARVRWLKYQNLVWLAALWLAVAAAVLRLSGSFLAAVIAAFLAARPFLDGANPQGVNDLYTELPGAFLLITAALLLINAVRDPKRRGFFVAGVCFGLLALTKAAMLYVFIGVLLVLLATYVFRSLRRGEHALHVAILFAGAAVVVAPWIGRNWLTFHQAQISDRGGLVLYTRALMDQVTPAEYKGSFYVWARPSLRARVGSVLGFTPADLGLGGRLQRLNDDLDTEVHAHDMQAELAGRPQDAITFHRQARAERVRLTGYFEQRRDPYPEVAADRAMSHEAVGIIKRLFWPNLALAVPLLWRCAPLIFPAVLLAFVWGLYARQYALALFTLPGLGLLAFYALATHFEPRPAIVAQSTAVIGMVSVVSLLVSRLLSRRVPPQDAVLAHMPLHTAAPKSAL